MQIAMIGSGYVGLVSGACFADFGHDVTCVDTNREKIDAIGRGELPIYEPGLQEMVAHNMASSRLRFTHDLAKAVADAAAVFICVGTPPRSDGDGADLGATFAAARQVAQAATKPLVLVMKSTVPVGTGDAIAAAIAEAAPQASITVVSNPEFLREGAAIYDFKHPDRVVVGTDDPAALELMRDIYRPLFINRDPVMHTARRAAEMIKYAANAFLATKITFINEIADLCERTGVNVQQVARGIGLDNRIGSKFLHAGPGYGGSCFPKDTRALMQTAREYHADLQIVETVIAVNGARKEAMAQRILATLGDTPRGSTVAILGLTFKPFTDDVRESVALTIIPRLQEAGVTVRAYDPKGMEQAAQVLRDVAYCDNAYDCVRDAHAVALLTEWEEFRGLDLARIRTLVARPAFVDLRNVYHPGDMQKLGFNYQSIGRPAQ